jgi:hypothetical protein
MTMVFTPDPGIPGLVHSFGDMYALVGTITFTGSYATGGDTLDLTALFKRTGDGKGIRVVTTLRGNEPEYDPVAKKLKLYGSANTEVAAAAYNAALTASPVPVVVIGK